MKLAQIDWKSPRRKETKIVTEIFHLYRIHAYCTPNQTIVLYL